MESIFEKRRAGLFILAIAVLCAAGVASYQSTLEFAEAGKAVAGSHEVLREVETTLLAVREAEVHQLSFLASGNEGTKQASAPSSSINGRFSKLKEMAAGTNGRLERVRELEHYVLQEIRLLQKLSDSRRGNPAQASDLAADWSSVSGLASQIRTSAAAIADAENTALKYHSETVQVSGRRAAISFLSFAALTAVFIGITFYRFSRDTFERRRALEQSHHSEERYRLLADNSLDLIALLDLKNTLIYASPSYETVLGYDPSWLVGRVFSEFIHPEDLPAVRLAISQLPDRGPGKPIDGRLLQANGDWLDVELLLSTFSIRGVAGHRILLSARSIAERKRSQRERETLIQELQEAFARIKVLSGFIPICASCKKIRDDQGYWNQLEAYLQSHTEAQFSHGICPDCATALYPDYFTKGA